MHVRRPGVLAAAAIVFTIAWASASAACKPADKSPDPGDDVTPAAPGSFALGVEYMELGLGEIYGDAGVRWAKTRLEAFSWGRIEPKAPVDGVHSYEWALTDRLIREYQDAGIVNIQSYLESKSSWGSVGVRDVAPKPEHMADYGAFVRAIVERYDGDGQDDMDGLRAPVRHWVIGSEWTGFWPSGQVEPYLAMLETAAREARAAYAEVQVGAIPFLLGDVFSGNEPTAAEVAGRLKDPPPAFRNSTAGMHAILDRPDLFDYLDYHSLADYTEIPPAMRWFRAEMERRGYQKPIWIDDAFPAGYLANFRLGPNTGFPSLYPVTEATRARALTLLLAVGRQQEPAYSEARAWIDTIAAQGVIRKAVTALGEGSAGIQIGNLEDWMLDSGAGLREATVNLLGASAMYGMVEVSHPKGYQIDDVRTPGEPRPAYMNLELIAEVIGAGRFDAVARVGGLAGARGYRLERGDAVTWVLWNEAGLQFPGDPEPAVEFVLEAGEGVKGVTTVLSAASGRGVGDPVEAAAEGGKVTLTLTPSPVVVRVVR